MNRHPHHITTCLAAVLAAVGLAACDDTAADGDDLTKTEVTETIAAVTLEDGSQFRFYEPSPGELVVAAVAKSDESLSAMAMLTKEQPSAPALYRALADAEPPRALLDAHVRADGLLRRAALDAAAHRLQIEKPRADDETRVSSALTGAEFYGAYCRSNGWDYHVCRTNFEQVFSVDFFGTQFGCRVHGQVGQTLFIYQAWRPFRIDSWTITVDPHENHYIYTYGIPTRRRCDALPLPLVDGSGNRTRYDATAYGDYVL